MEILLVVVLLGVFLGPSAYRRDDKYKGRKRGAAKGEPRQGPTYGQRMLRMLTPVFLLIAFLVALAIGVTYLEKQGTINLPSRPPATQTTP